jgi:chemotaxis protein methyltransferase CheR
MSDLPMSPQVFSILSALVEERVGLSYTLADKEIFESKVSLRALEAGFESMLDYYYCLRYDDPEQREFRRLAEALLVHETFFFRELEPLRVAIANFVAPRVRAGHRARIWCAACATGEEPVTIAMLLREAELDQHVDLVASDLSESALERARKGVFSPRALRQHRDHPLAVRYLETRPDAIIARSELVNSIDFCSINLIDPTAVQALGSFDLVVCRNVLIYFGDERTRAVAELLAARVRDHGALLIGVSESLMRFGTSLVCEEHGGVFVYRPRDPATHAETQHVEAPRTSRSRS